MGRHRYRRQSAQSPNPQTDYFYVYQGSSVGFTTAQLLDNDTDPQRQPLTVVAVSEPSNNGTLTGTLVDGFVYTPGTAAGLIGTDIQLNYLVTDTDGHVTQENITIRVLAAGDTNAIPVARADVARTNAGSSTGALFVLGNDFDPDGGGVGLVEVSTPANGTVSFNGSYIINYIPNAGFSGVETITYTIRDDEGLTATGTLTVWVDTGAVSAAQSPNPQTDYFYVYQGSSVGFTTAQLLDNDTDPQRQPLTVVAVSEPSNNGTLTGTLTDGFVYTPEHRRRPHRHRHPTQLPRHRHRRPRHPREHHHPHPRRRRHQRHPGGAGGCGADECGVLDRGTVRARQRLRPRRRRRRPGRGVHPRQRHRVVQRQLHHQLHPQRRVLRRRDHHLHHPRRPKASPPPAP